ncbi:uncharacterized protein LOC123620178 isoform X3 [Lemur catta]|uniref:uncharacterized protein LOC123620178 isoform X3 n=1 Tax=Lemur catta TaxID=9447 RepID=UPI001E2690E3|nr:uncharacterized protein LOC123620178 isoform X3 [Lemur catta]
MPSSYKKYINQLKIVLRADVMMPWLSQETHESDSSLVTGRWRRPKVPGPSGATWVRGSLWLCPASKRCPGRTRKARLALLLGVANTWTVTATKRRVLPGRPVGGEEPGAERGCHEPVGRGKLSLRAQPTDPAVLPPQGLRRQQGTERANRCFTVGRPGRPHVPAGWSRSRPPGRRRAGVVGPGRTSGGGHSSSAEHFPSNQEDVRQTAGRQGGRMLTPGEAAEGPVGTSCAVPAAPVDVGFSQDKATRHLHTRKERRASGRVLAAPATQGHRATIPYWDLWDQMCFGIQNISPFQRRWGVAIGPALENPASPLPPKRPCFGEILWDTRRSCRWSVALGGFSLVGFISSRWETGTEAQRGQAKVNPSARLQPRPA